MDQLEQLERLARLRDSGALTEDEFQQHKTRLLETRPTARRIIWQWALAVAASAVVGLYFLTRDRTADPASNSKTGAQSERLASNVNSAQSDQMPQPKASPPVVEVNSRLSIAGGCQFAPELEQAFARMLFYDQVRQRFRPRVVQIGGMSLTPTLTSEPDVGGPEPGDRAHIASVRIPTPVNWGGLQLSGLQASNAFEASSSALELEIVQRVSARFFKARASESQHLRANAEFRPMAAKRRSPSRPAAAELD